MKKLLTLFILTFACLLPIKPTFAHVLEFNNGIGAVLHIDPQDDPVAGEQTMFYFEFRDRNSRFNARDCDCTLTIKDGSNSQLLSTLMSAPSSDATSASFVFPTRGVYQLSVAGMPNQADAFSSFELDFTVRVNKGTEAAGTSKVDYGERGLFVATGGIIGLIFFLLIRQQIVYNVKHSNNLSFKKESKRKARK